MLSAHISVHNVESAEVKGFVACIAQGQTCAVTLDVMKQSSVTLFFAKLDDILAFSKSLEREYDALKAH